MTIFDDDSSGQGEATTTVELLRADLVWEFFDAVERRLNILLEQKEAKGSELIRLMVASRREMLEGFMEFVEVNSISFKELCNQLGYDIRYMEDS